MEIRKLHDNKIHTTLMPGAGAKILLFLCVLFIFAGGVCGNLGIDWYVFCNHNSIYRNVLCCALAAIVPSASFHIQKEN
jgi:hypothetical protein